jgi:anti-sigma regulatory factor (Ser/Thr protein kinase)
VPVTARFSCDPYSVVEARELVAAATAGCPETSIADATLLASELVSNVILHARTPFEVLVDRFADRLRVTVCDESTDPPSVRDPGPEEVGGRGLVLVTRLSDRWGFEADHQGKSVWFELGL